MNKPTFIYRDGMIADEEYVEWLSELKQRFHSSQAKAAVRVNTAMLEYYWSLGRDIIQKQAESKWGSGFFNQLSHDMRAMFQEETGFSAANLRYMKRWYAFYFEHAAKSQRPVDKSASQFLQRPVEEILKEWVDEV